MIDALTFWSVAGGLGSAGAFVIGALWRQTNARSATVFKRIDEIKRDAANFREKVAEEYVTTKRLEQALEPILRQLDRIETLARDGVRERP